jgi:hypothetical protein
MPAETRILFSLAARAARAHYSDFSPDFFDCHIPQGYQGETSAT